MLFFKALGGRAPKPLFFGDDHLDDLPAPGDEIGQELGFGIGQRPDGGPRRFGEAGDDGGVEGIGFRSLAERLGEGPDLRRIDDGDGEARSRQSRSDNGFEPARGLQGDGDRIEGGKLGAEAVQAFRVAFDRKSFTRGPKRHIELIL